MRLGLAVRILAVLAIGAGPLWGQGSSVGDPLADKEMELAGTLIGKSLFLRGFYLENTLNYDLAGRVVGAPKIGDWTLAGVNVLKVERRGENEIELDGVRVAIRYNLDNHEFQRHAQNDEKVRVVLKDPGNVKRLEEAFTGMFAVGIDPAFQRAMPEYWRHYFDPSLAWPQDELTGQTIYPMYGTADQGKGVTAPKVEHDIEPKYGLIALHEKVQGAVRLRLVVDASGVPQRIAVSRPLGYGLDSSAVEAVKKWRFAAGTKDGSAAATGVLVEQQFSLTNIPR